jgi:four helix bundle protein
MWFLGNQALPVLRHRYRHRRSASALGIGARHRRSASASASAFGFGTRIRRSDSALGFGARLRRSASALGFGARLRHSASARRLSPRACRGPYGLHGLDVYRVSLDFYRDLLAVIDRVGNDHVTRQGKRACESVLLNIGEAHPARGADRARRFQIAANEASECRVVIDILELRGDIAGEQLATLRELNGRQGAMLRRLSRRR